MTSSLPSPVHHLMEPLPGIQSVQHPLRQLQHLCLGPGVAVGQQGLPILDFMIAHGISSHIRLMPS